MFPILHCSIVAVYIKLRFNYRPSLSYNVAQSSLKQEGVGHFFMTDIFSCLRKTHLHSTPPHSPLPHVVTKLILLHQGIVRYLFLYIDFRV